MNESRRIVYFYGLVKFLIFWESHRGGAFVLFYDDDDDDELFDLASQKQRTFCGERDADRTRSWREIVSKKKKKKTSGGWRVFF